jgi:DNA-binding NtrC family response regulator
MTARSRILVVDDEAALLDLLTEALTGWGYEVLAASTADQAVAMVKSQVVDAALVDIQLGKQSGLDVLREIKRRDGAIEVVMITGYPAVNTSVQALREGAYDYLTKPMNLDELRHLMARVIERRFLRGEVNALRVELGDRLAVRDLLGLSPQMEQVKETVTKVAATDTTVLIEGESGTGKEVAAAVIHRCSPRSKGPFIPVNCGAIPRDLLESEFFGHVRGAFSGAVADTAGLFRSAHGGTIFLDEVAELPPALQVKLLRVLQEKEVRPVGATKTYSVDVRIVAATNRRLDDLVKDGSFRQDLFYRLNVVRIVMPPLRERPEDIPVLLTHLLKRYNQRFGRDVRGVEPGALAALQAYPFRGNVRELENLLERAYALGASGMIALADLPSLSSAPAPAPAPPTELPNLAQMERELILRALRIHGNDRQRAARALGISDRTIYRRLKEYRML